MIFRFVWLLGLFIIITLNLSAHVHKYQEHHTAKKDTVQEKIDNPTANQSNKVTISEKNKFEKPFKINYLEEALSHVHNKLVHYPISLSLLGLLFTIISFRWKQFEFSIKNIVLIAAIFSIPKMIVGLFQPDNFIGEPKEWIVNNHKMFGITLSVLLWIWVIFLSFKPLKKYAWYIAFISASITRITAFNDGIAAAAH